MINSSIFKVDLIAANHDFRQIKRRERLLGLFLAVDQKKRLVGIHLGDKTHEADDLSVDLLVFKDAERVDEAWLEV